MYTYKYMSVPPNTYIPNYMSVHVSPQPILSHTNSVHALAPYFIKTDINFILPSTPSSSCLAQISEPKILCAFLFSVNRATCAAHLIPKNTWWGVQILKLLIMEFSLFPCYSSITWQSILSHRHSIFVIPWMWPTECHTNIKQSKLQLFLQS
jgi:hypothetical protein